MEINGFIGKFAELFDETNPEEFTANTVFKDLDEWSSLISLSLIAMVDDEYNVRIKGDDIKNAKTIRDLYLLVDSKL